ncbi:MAG: GatB/YqeY domain-containing protein [Pseudomonadota bacterium]
MRDRLSGSLTEAMKAKDRGRVSTLRLINAAIKDRDIAARAEDRCEGASEDEIRLILSKMVRQREESAATYEDAGRVELAEKEREEISIIQEFLPRQLDEAEIKSACAEVVEELEASSLKDMGKCMGALKERYPGQMDFGKAGGVIKSILG